MLPLKTILHATDFSVEADYAFRLACSLARDHGARLVVAHVVAPAPAVAYGEMLVEPDQAALDKAWEQIRRIQPPEAAVPVQHRVEQGFAADEILRLARELPADMIVLGTHGRSGLGRLLMGSVAEQVVRKAPCPVLVVKPPLRWKQAPEPEPCGEGI